MALALITGVAGFTGKYLVQALADAGIQSAGLGVEPRPLGVNLADYRQVDLLDSEATARAVAQIAPDYVFHLAGMSHVALGHADDIYRVNILGSRNLLVALSKSPRPLKRLVLASTANLYGNQEGVLTEETRPCPMNDYAVSKLSMEYMAGLFRDCLPITVVRPFNYTGRGQSPAFLIPKLVKCFQTKAPEVELGNTDVVRDFSDVRDVARRYALLAITESATWGPFNFCSGRGLSLSEILQMLHRITGHTPTIRINPAFVRPNEVRCLVGSMDRLTQIIGPTPVIPFEDTLNWMLGEDA